MKILLIQPKMNKRPMDTDLKTRMAPSLALLTLMRLTPDGHEMTLVNENVERLNLDTDADLVGITVTLDVMPRACFIAEVFRKRGTPVVAGGIHVTCSPDTCLAFFTAICVGPAERVWARIVADAESGALGSPLRNPAKEYRDVSDFRGAEIASPLYEGMDTGKYLYSNIVTTSRGCPNRCTFCYNSAANRLHTVRPVADVLRDIRALGTRHVLFIDDNFIGSPTHARTLMQEFSKMNLVWSAAVTASILNEPELLDMMASSGCQSLFIGLESINTASLADVNKANRVEQYEQLVEAIHGRGIMVDVSMVFGLDGDDVSTFQRTLDWLIAMRVETLTSHILTPYPGTELYRRMEAAGRIIDHDLTHFNTAHVVFRPKNMTAKELYSGYLWMYRQFYSLRSIIRRYPKEKGRRRPYLLFNLLYRKYGRMTSLLSRLVPMQVLGKLATWLSYKHDGDGWELW